jgi:hypothetical protein
MAVEIMAAIWPAQFAAVSEKMVALCLADSADAVQGITWLPIRSKRGRQDMILKTGLSERQIQRALRSLEAAGWIDRFENPGRGCLIRVHRAPISRGDMVTPVRGDMVTGLRGDTMTGRGDMVTGKTSINRQIKKQGGEAGEPVDNLSPDRPLPASLMAWQWGAYVDVRRAIGRPLTPQSSAMLLSKLDAIEAEGWHIGDVVERATVNGWTDFHLPAPGRSAGVRRMVDGQVIKGPGSTAEDMAAAAEIDALDNLNERLTARAEFFAKAERRNEAIGLGDLVGTLPIFQGRRGKDTK